MPRPKPSPEDTPVPRSIAFQKKVLIAGDRLVPSPKGHELRIRDRTDLVNTALREYIEKHYPGLIAQVVKEIREGIEDQGTLLFQAVHHDLKVAEPMAPYGKARPQLPAAAHVYRNRKRKRKSASCELSGGCPSGAKLREMGWKK